MRKINSSVLIALAYAVFSYALEQEYPETESINRLRGVRHLQHQHPTSSVRRNKSSQRVVIFAGPHKTGSSSIQYNLSRWTRMDIISGWIWPTLKEEGWEYGKDYWSLALDIYMGYKEQDRRKAYEKLFRNVWANGQNIVFGSETFDMVCQGSQGSNRLLNGLLEMMPWITNPKLPGSSADITMVVTYRSPRVEHLISVWHQIGGWGNPLSKFILELPSSDRQWHSSLNPLGVANKFVEKGLKTVLVDLSGVKDSGLDVSEVVACEVVDPSACQNDKLLWTDESNAAIVNAQRDRGPMDLDSETLQLIDEVLIRLDASYCHLMQQDNFEILYPHYVFSWCGEDSRESPIDSHDAVFLIKQIVRDARASG